MLLIPGGAHTGAATLIVCDGPMASASEGLGEAATDRMRLRGGVPEAVRADPGRFGARRAMYPAILDGFAQGVGVARGGSLFLRLSPVRP